MATSSKLMTADELWHLPDDGQRHELVAGELRTLAPSGGQHGRIAMKLSIPLGQYVYAHDLGEMFGAEAGFKIGENPDTVRAPDVAFVRRERVLAIGDVQGYVPGAPDLAVEVISPGDLYTEVDEKIAMWLEAGVRMVLAVDPRRRTVAVHRPGQPVRLLTERDDIDGEDVVPGWRLSVREVFAFGQPN
jgi:Uma2 family endonuclease